MVFIFFLTGCETTSPFHRVSGTGAFDTVVIDAGHGGHDNGARAKAGNFEKVLTLDTTRRLAATLRKAGLNVVETRTGDYFVTLDDRVGFSNRIKNSIFVSVHYNWSNRSGARGIETYYMNPNSARLASRIQQKMLRVYSSPDRGIKTRSLFVLRNNKRPAVLCELGFVSNGSENKVLQDSGQRQRLADAIASAILAEYEANKPPQQQQMPSTRKNHTNGNVVNFLFKIGSTGACSQFSKTVA